MRVMLFSKSIVTVLTRVNKNLIITYSMFIYIYIYIVISFDISPPSLH